MQAGGRAAALGRMLSAWFRMQEVVVWEGTWITDLDGGVARWASWRRRFVFGEERRQKPGAPAV